MPNRRGVEHTVRCSLRVPIAVPDEGTVLILRYVLGRTDRWIPSVVRGPANVICLLRLVSRCMSGGRRMVDICRHSSVRSLARVTCCC